MSKHGFFRHHFAHRQGSSNNIPAEYIQEHMEDDGLNSAMTTPPLTYLPRINSFATSETNEMLESEEDTLFNDAREELQLLKEAIMKYQQKTDHKSIAIIKADGTINSWKGVKDAVELAKSREDGEDSDSRSARASCQKIAENISALEAWLELLPGGDYGAVVSGVFKMVVTAAGRAHDVRVTIFQALADIPYWVGRATRYRDLYRDTNARELAQKTAQLCSAVLVALRYIMIYFTENILKKALKAVAQGQAYKQTLLDQIDRVRNLIIDVNEEASISLQYRVRDLDKRCREYFQDLTGELKELKEQQDTKGVSLDEATKKDLTARITKSTATYAINTFYSLLSSNPSINGKIRSSAPSQVLEARPSAQTKDSRDPSINQESIISALKVPPDLTQQDLKRCLSMATALSLVDQDRVEWMILSPKLRDWLSLPASRTLLLNGNGDANEMFSPTTILSAKLIQSLAHVAPIITLHFFCPLHTTSRTDTNTMANATGLIKSFISQLLSRDIPWDLNFLSTADVAKIQANDIETICMLFQRLLQQLPEATFLFWMIDGINFYERSERRQNFLKVIQELLGIIRGCNHLVIKMLLTCPGMSSYVKNYLSKEDVMIVPLTVDGNRQGWSERAFQRTIGHELDKVGPNASAE